MFYMDFKDRPIGSAFALFALVFLCLAQVSRGFWLLALIFLLLHAFTSPDRHA